MPIYERRHTTRKRHSAAGAASPAPASENSAFFERTPQSAIMHTAAASRAIAGRYGGRAPALLPSIVPKNMTPDELTEISFDCRRRFNSVRSIISRAFEFHTNMRTPYRFLTYLLYNPLFRKEVFKKQGLHFGLEDGKGASA